MKKLFILTLVALVGCASANHKPTCKESVAFWSNPIDPILIKDCKQVSEKTGEVFYYVEYVKYRGQSAPLPGQPLPGDPWAIHTPDGYVFAISTPLGPDGLLGRGHQLYWNGQYGPDFNEILDLKTENMFNCVLRDPEDKYSTVRCEGSGKPIYQAERWTAEGKRQFFVGYGLDVYGPFDWSVIDIKIVDVDGRKVPQFIALKDARLDQPYRVTGNEWGERLPQIGTHL